MGLFLNSGGSSPSTGQLSQLSSKTRLSDEKTEGRTVAGSSHFSPKLCVPATLFPKPSTSDSRERTMDEQKEDGMEVQDQDQQRAGSKGCHPHNRTPG